MNPECLDREFDVLAVPCVPAVAVLPCLMCTLYREVTGQSFKSTCLPISVLAYFCQQIKFIKVSVSLVLEISVFSCCSNSDLNIV